MQASQSVSLGNQRGGANDGGLVKRKASYTPSTVSHNYTVLGGSII